MGTDHTLFALIDGNFKFKHKATDIGFTPCRKRVDDGKSV
jgi:ribosomal protein L27